MKKLIIAIIALVIAASMIGCSAESGANSNDNSNAKSPTANKSDGKSPANNSEEKDGEKEMKPHNVFFSPYTGSDEKGDATQWSPVETKKQAEKLAKDITLADDEELVFLEYLMTVDVKTMEAAGVFSDAGGINMIPFTGSADGHYFKGEIVGTGCDTQKYLPNDGGVLFSARYMLKGKDLNGQDCSIFIENNGPALELCTPTIITDSRALSDWQYYDLRAIVVPVGGGVSVNVYRIHND